MIIDIALKGTSLYLGDLENKVDDQIIYQKFKSFGNIKSLKVFSPQSKKDCTHAIITFATEQQAEKAKNEMNHEKLLNREIRVLWYNPEYKPNPEANIFLKNIPKEMSAKVLEQMLIDKFGSVESLKIKENNYGYVQFENKESAEQCILRINEISEQIICQKYYQKDERIDAHQVNDTIIFTKNLKITIDNEMLQKGYEKYGNVIKCILKEPEEKQKGKSYKPTKFGYIFFENKYDAKEALKNAVKDEDLKELYEDSKVYVNFLLNKEAKGRYTNKQKACTQKNNKDVLIQELQQQNFMMKMMMNKMMPFGQMPIMGGHQQSHSRQMGGQRNEANHQFRQNQQNQYSKQSYYQQQQQQMNINKMPQPPMMSQNHIIPPNQIIEQDQQHHGQFRQQYQIQPQKLNLNRFAFMPNPQMIIPQIPMQQQQFQNIEDIKTYLPNFLSLREQNQREIFREILHPKVKDIVNDDALAPNITEMLTDFKVFEISDILGFIENESILKEQINKNMKKLDG